MLAVAASVAIHAALMMLILAFTFPNSMVERPRPARPYTMILLAAPPVIHAVPQAARRTDMLPSRLFHAPVIRSLATPLREAAPVAAVQIPLLEIARPLLPALEIARLPVVPAPPLRTDNLAPSVARAPAASASNHTSVVLRSSGFEQLAFEPSPRQQAPPLLGGEFADATMIPASRPQRASIAPALPVTRSVEILSKPRPAYTEEARRQRVEGEVLLQILFTASGEVRVLRTVLSLGHGLDENAIAAAEAIRFRPAERAGVAADSTAIVHIVFQLAY